jgi:hypothetical protein
MISAARPPSSSPAQRQEPACRPDAAGQARHRDDFQRVLRDKAGDRDDEHDGDAAAPDAASCGVALAPPCAAPALAAAARMADALAGGRSAAEAGGLGAALNGSLAAAGETSSLPAAALRGDTQESAWQVSLHEPMGVPVELHATRPATSAREPAPWTLTIGSSALDAAALARHAPRLNERLRVRGKVHTHVRIEGEDDRS